ncbi:hypothetical protein [Sporosarcina phage Lietuvens]|nr:hypothetical protein [Sporosarcina phage Lietuvens]
MLDKLNYGDIVTVRGYPIEYWEIEAFNTNIYSDRYVDEEIDHAVNLTCPWTGEINVAMIEDITVVALADEAVDFLADKPEPPKVKSSGMSLASIFGWDDEESRPLTPVTPKSKKPAQRARIDELLDERNAVDDIAFEIEESRAQRYAEIDRLLAQIAKEVAE